MIPVGVTGDIFDYFLKLEASPEDIVENDDWSYCVSAHSSLSC